ncbi:PTS system, diacetylchitobiose-specific IIB component [Borrelia duttonii CR2A]|uniref:PTS system, diacetylchitobiose-specific IIB component n=1 Tax=Borrelia duttonii CR2A TaxID=1432657 RepID=W6TFN9_9SPIR|nr:PTS sugar transporter subunit IIB [Borrelia duttonii]ETZ17602.1 PTS system, diacetylchitobiose-specific IIB component [Borrelia duttonii CR2A]
MKILLVCESGMSTSILEQRMKKYVEVNDIDVKIKSIASAKFQNIIDNSDFDIVLLAPQVRFLKTRLEEIIKPKNTPIELINTIDYGTVNGENVTKFAINVISKSEFKGGSQ